MNDYLDYICHHGIKGQRWGYRKYQNEDGSLTEAGRERYGVGKQRNYLLERSISKKEKDVSELRDLASNTTDEKLKKKYNDSADRIEATIRRQQNKLNNTMSAEGKRQFKIDKRAIKGQRLYEKGEAITEVRTAANIVDSVLSVIGGLSMAAAAKIGGGSPLISVGEHTAQVALLSIGGASIAGMGINEAITLAKVRNLRAFYTNGGDKKYHEINGTKGAKQ